MNDAIWRPALFNSWSVNAILDGRKTHTRRVIRGESLDVIDRWVEPCIQDKWWGYIGSTIAARPKCPYGKQGDFLWVRETCWRNGGYVATDKQNFENEGKVPSIFMRRYDSRISLRVLNVRVERVQDIREHEVFLEGIEHCLDCDAYILSHRENEWHEQTDDFARLWDSINKKRGFGWSVNPWVFVTEFEVVQ